MAGTLTDYVAGWLRRTSHFILAGKVKRQYREIYDEYPDVIRDMANKAEMLAGTSYATTDRQAAIIEGKQEMVRHFIAMASTDDMEVMRLFEDIEIEDGN